MRSVIIIIIILIILIAIIIIMNNNTHIEGFHWDPLWEGRDSQNCYKETLDNCLNYSNCGICHQNGHKKCVPGDMNGAFFDETCQAWTYKDHYERNIFNENVTRTTPQWSKFYNTDYEVWYPSPITNSTLMSFKEQAAPSPYST